MKKKIHHRDYAVKFISDPDIICVAEAWRAEGVDRHALDFDITKFVNAVFLPKMETLRGVQLILTTHPDEEDAAYVTYEPGPAMHLDTTLWQEASLGDPRGRYMIAHEMAHCIFHSHEAKAFSDYGDSKLAAFQNENRAEHHANLYSGYFLVPDYIVRLLKRADEIAIRCSVEISVAERRILQYSRKYLQSISQFGELCPNCGSMLFQRGIRVFCKSMDCFYEIAL